MNRSRGDREDEPVEGRTADARRGWIMVRVLRRILTPTSAIWHNDQTGRPFMRTLTAYGEPPPGSSTMG
ncbi:hypothetical protein [Streptomyces scopuliridis]|uniref:Uncharacterized protein n=1 Tax=Streptomyces scopuliridis RB72 TaxID=1440053 RepID=A0A2T7TFX5_9ACTN|nr:hypothetical protein [Streptomyces scopuliridis]PVE14049.1 hypothetical protein Y717_27995 [Streptomyces scopuliridis RB72]